MSIRYPSILPFFIILLCSSFQLVAQQNGINDIRFSSGSELGWTIHCSSDTGAVDIVFCIDSTRSMRDEIDEVRAAIGGLITALDATGYDYMLGAVTYGDGTNVWDFDSVAPGNQLTSDIALFTSSEYLGGMEADGGWDTTEQALDCIADAITEIEWRLGALHIIVGFTDAAYCQVGDGCDKCNFGHGAFASPATETDTGIAKLVDSTNTLVFMATADTVYTESCASFTNPVPPHPPWNSPSFTGWYQRFCYISNGQWYNMATVSWDSIFADISGLLESSITLEIEMVNNSDSVISPVTAEFVPESCLAVLSPEQIIEPSLAASDTHIFIWYLDYDTACIPGPELCFDIFIAGGDYTDTVRGCLFLDNCQCSGPVPEIISPIPCSVWTACDSQGIIIRFEDDDAGADTSTIQLMVDSVLYSYPTAMTWSDSTATVGELIFSPSLSWEHGQFVDYLVTRANDYYGCPVEGDAYNSFRVDLEPPENLGWSPVCSSVITDTFIHIEIEVEDFESGIDTAGIFFTVNDDICSLDVAYFGTDSSGTALLEGTLMQLGLDDADTVQICLDICDNVSSLYCGPNCAEYCCVFYLEENLPPMAEFVCPAASSFVSCNPPRIAMHLWDTVGAGVDSTSVVLNVNGRDYVYGHPWLYVTVDSLFFQPPPDAFADGDTICACLTALSDTLGAVCRELPICLE